ncbi:MAG: Rpn family recombination-promoting nuclease/putative transposase [Deltaproteobacteria bacterium]|nr:Rpn family recombination-promoting nuclease/putative transposase [Deltaproteobacteria bacterium]
MTAQPHDSIFKAVFSRTENAAGLLRGILSTNLASHPSLAELAGALDWSTLTLQPGSFIDEQLKPSHTDLLFSIQIAGKPVLVYVLVEHQSRNERRMPLRFHKYMGRIWTQLDDESYTVLPPILCIVLSHARPQWTGMLTFGALFDPEVISNPAISQFVPDFTIVVEDLEHRSDEDLAALRLATLPTLTLWMLRDGHAEELLWEGLEVWAPQVIEMLRDPDGMLFLSYFTSRFKDFSFRRLGDKLTEVTPDAKDALMEFIEQWRTEGREQGLERGLARGLARGQITLLTKLLSLKFGELSAQARAHLENANPTEIDKWAERVLRATTLDEVFAD